MKRVNKKIFLLLIVFTCIVFAIGYLLNKDMGNASFDMALAALFYCYYVDEKHSDK